MFIGRSQHHNHNVSQARIMTAKPALLTAPTGEQEPAVVIHAHGNVYAVLPVADALRVATDIANALAAHNENEATP